MKPEIRERLEEMEAGLRLDPPRSAETEFDGPKTRVAETSTGLKENREYTFTITWRDGRGKVWNGEFTNRVLSIRDRQKVGIYRARMAQGVTQESLDPLTDEINLMIAHLTVSLVKRPPWAVDLGALDEVRLLQEIYLEVLSHEAMFFGYGTGPETR